MPARLSPFSLERYTLETLRRAAANAAAVAIWKGPMAQRIARITVVVREYDEAIRFYTETLGFRLLEDTDLGGGKRWVRVGPAGVAGAELLLARAATAEQALCVGHQTGGRVSLFLETDDFQRDYAALRGRGVVFVGPPREEAYGTVAVFLDLYGNKIDLIEPQRERFNDA